MTQESVIASGSSTGSRWLTAWGYKTQLPVDNGKMVKLGRDAAAAIKKVNKDRNYLVGSAGATFYPAGLTANS